MQTVRLGRTGLNVSVAGLGAGGHSRLGQMQGRDRGHSVDLVRRALDSGVTLIDTAAAYGTEEIVGEAIRGREGIVVSTKVWLTHGGLHDTTGLISAVEFDERLDESLARLGVDCIDILHLHGVAPQQYDHCVDVYVPRLEAARQKGKIRFTGLTERFASDTDHAMMRRAVADDCWDVLMLGLNLVNQSAIRTLLPQAMEKDLGTLCMFAVRGPLAKKETAMQLLRRLVEAGEVAERWLAEDDPLAFLTAPGAAATLSEAAYRYCRHVPGMDVIVTGTGNPHHLDENLAAICGPRLPDDVLARLADMFGRVDGASGDM